MPLPATYAVGTVTVAAGNPAVTGQGTNFLVGGIRAGDILAIKGLTVSVLSVESATTLTLREGWPGTTQTAQPYEIRYLGDPSRVLSQTHAALAAFENGGVVDPGPVSWLTLTDKPSTYPPSGHNHGWAQINNKPLTFAPAPHRHDASEIDNLVLGATDWIDITGKPTTFPPEPHPHVIEDVQYLDIALAGKADTSHRHDASDIDNLPTGGGGASINDASTSTTEVWSASKVSTELAGKLSASAVSAFGLALLDDADAAAMRTTLGLGAAATWTAVPNDHVTNARLANMAAGTLKGNNTAGSADPLDLTYAQVKTALAYTIGDVSGLQTALDSATAGVAMAFPSHLRDGAKYWTTLATGAPETIASPTTGTTLTVNADGTITFPSTSTGTVNFVGKGVVPYRPDRTYRITADVRARVAIPPANRLRAAVRRLSDTFGNINAITGGDLTPTVVDTWQSRSATITTTANASAVWARLGIQDGAVGTPAADIDVRSIHFEDITEALGSASTTFATLAELLASNATFPWGSTVNTRAEGYAYTVVSVAADLTTAGGVMLRALPRGGQFVPQQFGALGDDAANDTVALQACFDAAVARGAAVHLPPATYRASALTLPTGLTLQGSGRQSLIRRMAGTSAHLLGATGQARITVRNFALDGRWSSTTGSPHNIRFDGCNAVLVDDIVSIDSRRNGVTFVNGTDAANDTASEIRNCEVQNGVGFGVEVIDSHRVRIIANRINKVQSHGMRIYGATAGATQDIVVADNSILEAGANGIDISFIGGGTSATPGVSSITISGNIVEGSATNGIMVQAAKATVTGNVARGNGTLIAHQGILINAEGVVVSGNTTADNAGVGIDFGDCKRVVCTGNYVHANGIIGIEINSTEDFSVASNIVTGNNVVTGAGAKSAGILVHQGSGGYPFVGISSNGALVGNIVRTGPNQQYGIKIEAETTNIRVIGNDTASSGSVRHIEIATPSGGFVTAANIGTATNLVPAATVTIPQTTALFNVSAGGTVINNIVTDSGTYELGRQITLRFLGGATVGNGTGNVYLNGSGNFPAVNGAVLQLVLIDSANWAEIGRRLP